MSDAEFEAAINSPEVNDAKLALAHRAADYWRSIAPHRWQHRTHPLHEIAHGAEANVCSCDYSASVANGF